MNNAADGRHLHDVTRRLAQEFRDVPQEEVERYVHESVAALSDARVTAFIPVLAERRVRARIRTRAVG